LILFCAHIGIFVMIGMLFKSCKLPDGQQLTMTGVLNYIYCGTDYACMFHGLWISASGMFMWSMMIDHFGSDFSFTFEWLKCMVRDFVQLHFQSFTFFPFWGYCILIASYFPSKFQSTFFLQGDGEMAWPGCSS
jgi:hypothetical protein